MKKTKMATHLKVPSVPSFSGNEGDIESGFALEAPRRSFSNFSHFPGKPALLSSPTRYAPQLPDLVMKTPSHLARHAFHSAFFAATLMKLVDVETWEGLKRRKGKEKTIDVTEENRIPSSTMITKTSTEIIHFICSDCGGNTTNSIRMSSQLSSS